MLCKKDVMFPSTPKKMVRKNTIAPLMPAANEEKKETTKINRLYYYIKDYCSNTSIHGLKYIVENNAYCIERIFWFLVYFCSVVGAIKFLYPVFERYGEAGIVTSLGASGLPIVDVDFPAVTICNINRASSKLVDEEDNKPPWGKHYQSATSDIIRVMSKINRLVVDDNIKSANVTVVMQEERKCLKKLMRKIAQPLDEMALHCWWLGKKTNCSNLFRIRETDEGYCYSFNTGSRHSHQQNNKGRKWTDTCPESPIAENGTTWTNNTKGKRSRKINGFGPIMGLTVLLNPHQEDYFAPSNNFIGFKVLIHDPKDYAAVSRKGLLVPAGVEAYASVSVTTTVTTDDIRNVPKDDRDCLFDDENNLIIHDVYSYENCLTECRIRAITETCKCVPYMYQKLDSELVEDCDYYGMSCIKNNSRKFSSVRVVQDVKGLEDGMDHCNCPSNCRSVDYSTDMTIAAYHFNPKQTASIPNNTMTGDLVLLRVFFKDMFYDEYKRDLAYRWDDVVAAFGGIVSLFMGFSFVSGVELVYFFSLRIFLRLKGHPEK